MELVEKIEYQGTRLLREIKFIFAKKEKIKSENICSIRIFSLSNDANSGTFLFDYKTNAYEQTFVLQYDIEMQKIIIFHETNSLDLKRCPVCKAHYALWKNNHTCRAFRKEMEKEIFNFIINSREVRLKLLTEYNGNRLYQ